MTTSTRICGTIKPCWQTTSRH